jgi:hypothetical protein
MPARRPALTRTLLLLLTLCSAAVLAQPAAPTMRLRGTIESISESSMLIRERSGETIRLVLPETLSVGEVLPVDVSALQSGTFVGTAAVPGPDGTLSALEVLVFPEAMRGTGEGHHPWDLQPGSTMTNATVASVAPGAAGRAITLRYPEGEKTIVVPEGVPIVTLQPADRSLLVPGAKVIITAQMRDGQPTALRVVAGRNGFAPPM